MTRKLVKSGSPLEPEIGFSRAVLADAGASPDDVARTRMMLTDIRQWREAARAHGEFFRQARPACTFVQVGGFIDPGWLVEVEADAVLD